MRRFCKTIMILSIIILFICGRKAEPNKAEPSEAESSEAESSEAEAYEAKTEPSASPVENMMEVEVVRAQGKIYLHSL